MLHILLNSGLQLLCSFVFLSTPFMRERLLLLIVMVLLTSEGPLLVKDAANAGDTLSSSPESFSTVISLTAECRGNMGRAQRAALTLEVSHPLLGKNGLTTLTHPRVGNASSDSLKT